MTGFVAAYRWDSRWLRWLLDAYGAIPLRRREADVAALRRGMEMLKAGYLVIISPEGTRSGHGRLQKGHPGFVLLVLQSGAPVLPVVFYGSERYRDNLRRLRRTGFHIVVDKPFHLDASGIKVTRQFCADR